MKLTPEVVKSMSAEEIKLISDDDLIRLDNAGFLETLSVVQLNALTENQIGILAKKLYPDGWFSLFICINLSDLIDQYPSTKRNPYLEEQISSKHHVNHTYAFWVDI